MVSFGRSHHLLIVFTACLAMLAPYSLLAQQPPEPPPTRREPLTETIYGVAITDSYRWLEEQGSAETQAWIRAQDQYSQSVLKALSFRDQIQHRVEELLRADSVSVPFVRGQRYFFTKQSANQNQAIIYMREGLEGKDLALVDPNSMSSDQTISVRILDVSADGKWLLYARRQGGEDEFTALIFDIESRRELPDHLPRGRYFGLSFKKDKSGFYYSHYTYGPDIYGARVYYHTMGTDAKTDRMIFGDGYGPSQIIVATVSPDGRYLSITVVHGAAGDRVEIYVQNIAVQGPITTIVNDLPSLFLPKMVGDQMFLQTTWQAPKGRILAVDLRQPARRNWREVVPKSDDVIDSFTLVGGKIAVAYLKNACSQIKLFEPDGRFIRAAPRRGIGSASTLTGGWNSRDLFYSYSSFTMPPVIFRYDVLSGRQSIWARAGNAVPRLKFQTEQVFVTSKDGTRVPMFLVYKGVRHLDGNRPTLLTGYGGFKSNMLPAFSPQAVLWIELGGVYAVANLRGGGEYGDEWHRAGMLANKQNVFDDFIAAAEWLIRKGYTCSAKLAISGASNGGLLVGAVLTQRPELFTAAICAYPLLDMIRYHRFFFAGFWIPEYGTAEDPEQFKVLSQYSPYHHVRDGTNYPAVLFITGDADTRVAPHHARKMVARLQAASCSGKPILFAYDRNAGHFNGLPLNRRIIGMTNEISFLVWQLGLTNPFQALEGR